MRRDHMSRNAKNAILFRRAEKRILRDTVALVDREVHKLQRAWMTRDADPLRRKGDDNAFEIVPSSDEL